MNTSRSAITNALFATLQGAYAWAYSSKHFILWSSVDASQQPALFLRRPTENTTQTSAYGLNKYVLHYEAWIYFRTDINDTTVDPYTTFVDPLIDAIDAALAASPVTGRQQLGLGIDNAYISGHIPIADGMDDGQGVILIPIEVITGI